MQFPGHNLISYWCQHGHLLSYHSQPGHKLLINQCQTNGHYQLSMSTQTQALYQSMPDQWALSAINFYTDTRTLSINAKPMGTISYQCLHWHKHSINQCQTNGHDQLSMSTQTQAQHQSKPNQCARSAINIKHLIDQCQTNGHILSSYISMRTNLLCRSYQRGVCTKLSYMLN